MSSFASSSATSSFSAGKMNAIFSDTFLVPGFNDVSGALDSDAAFDFDDDLSGYGCHCRAPGVKAGGKPVDSIDAACLTWRRCHACVAEAYGMQKGQTCSKYRLRNNICGNNANDCRRGTCECDFQFAQTLSSIKNTISAAFMNFDDANCSSSRVNEGSNGAGPVCCRSSSTNLFTKFSPKHEICCSDGRVVEVGDLC